MADAAPDTSPSQLPTELLYLHQLSEEQEPDNFASVPTDTPDAPVVEPDQNLSCLCHLCFPVLMFPFNTIF